MKKLLSLVLLLASATLSAAPVTYYLSGVVFSDGGTAYGSFDYETASGFSYTNINITTTAGSAFGGQTYNFTFPPVNSSGTQLPVYSAPVSGDRSNAYAFGMVFSADLQFLPQSANLIGNRVEVDCGNSSCSSNTSLRTYTGGLVSQTAPVPLPAAAWLLLSGIGAIGAVARKRHAS